MRIASAHDAYVRGNHALGHGKLDEAIACYRDAVALKPDFAEASSNLGVALMAAGRPAEAEAAYRHAIAVNPNLATPYRNLGRVLVARGDVTGAIALSRRALGIAQSDDIKTFFVNCVRSLPPNAPPDPALEGIEPLLGRALTEGWGRPIELATVVADIVKRRLTTDNSLLLAHLVTAPVRDIELEHWLTRQRRSLLTTEDPSKLEFACALAQQCFINEYVFAQNADELQQAASLQDGIAAATPGSALRLATLACYVPLGTLPGAAELIDRRWGEPVRAVLDQQVRALIEERADRQHIPVLTAIDDKVSLAVREQYEERPYPRWVKTGVAGAPVALEGYLRSQFRHARLRPLGNTDRLDILIAGCGTGEHPIITARRYANAQVLAVDLSLTSLCYGRRMTRLMGVTNIEYAQADILKLGAIGRTFDAIEAVGVLHHLAGPEGGLRVLRSLLRPAGLMLIGLYSRLARRAVNCVRELIAQRGYGHGTGDIRRCRHELMALPDDSPLKAVTRLADFYSTSGCRDLLFHVQEHQFAILDIKAMLVANGLRFIGFAVDPAVQHMYAARFPHDIAMTDLDCWGALEAENPMIFTGMYQFWAQRE